ncbi:MAG: hypothetical protein AAB691_02830 [Patescibacteria group bacterium]
MKEGYTRLICELCGGEHLTEQHVDTLKTSETSPETKRKAMDRVIDIRSPDNKDILFHTLGYTHHIKDSQFLGGLFNTEKALTTGLVRKKFADRISMERSPFGHMSDFDYEIYAYPRNFYLSEITHFEPMSWSLVLDSKVKADRGEQEASIKGRVKPKDILGISVSHKVFSTNIREYFDDVVESQDSSSIWVYFQQLMIVATDLNLELSEDVIRRRQSLMELSKSDLVGSWQFISQECASLLKEILLLLKKDERFHNIGTAGDYLAKIGEKFNMPTYSEEAGLLWPELLSPLEVSKFVKERTSK